MSPVTILLLAMFNITHPSFRAFQLLFAGLVGLMIFACKPSASTPPPAAAGTGDFTGYEITDVEGTAFKRAVRKDAAGQMAVEGFILDNKKTGQWVEYSNEGYITSIENYIEGLLEGPSIKLSYRGQIDQRSNYHRGQLHGMQFNYKYGKVLKESNYSNGKLDGMVRSFDDKTFKVRQEIEYKDGLQHGYFRNYDENGAVNLEYIYKNGEKVSGGIVEKN